MSSDEENHKRLINQHALLSDVPIIETDRKDNLRFRPTAEVLASAALYTPDPITIGVFGNWGSGKTSLMRLMMDVVNEKGQGENAAVPVWFNAWQYEREEHLIIPLLATIARDISKKEAGWKENMKEGGKKIHAALRAVLYGLSMKGKLGIPGIADMEISASMKNMIERYEALTQDTLMARSLYFDAFDKLSDIAHDPDIKKPKIVVFVDDLDRCFPEQAVRLLESIKLVLHQPGFAFVLGIYPEIIEDFILSKYAKDYHFIASQSEASKDNASDKRMRQYLEYFKEYLSKIIQVRHYVPRRKASEMEDYIGKLMDKADVKSEFVTPGIEPKKLYSLIAEVGNRNPREIVRKLNGLIVKWRIRKSEAEASTTDTVEPAQFDLLAMLINEVLQEKKYDSFRDYLEYAPVKDEATTIGEYLAQALATDDVKTCTVHGLRCQKVRNIITIKDSPTMDSVLRTLEQDEHVCMILVTEAGRKWLSKKEYREELRETLKDEGTDTKQQDEDKVKVKAAKGFFYVLPKMVPIKGGTFMMGDSSDDDKPPHQVTLSAFEIGATPVTQAQYEAVMGARPSDLQGNSPIIPRWGISSKSVTNPSYFKGRDRPVENVSWEDAMVFCERLTKETGCKYTLPTEAQWEYACRAGSDTKYCFGDKKEKLADYAWYDENSDNETHTMRLKKPNEWGLYDMHGNVREWCHDWYGDYPTGSVTDPTGPSSGADRVLRGGCFCNEAGFCRSASRDKGVPSTRQLHIGFRLAAPLVR
jgi:formylglycine-generating enzyme required for sulfatase activity